MNKFFLTFSVGLAALALQSMQANAQAQQQRNCGQRAAIVASLASKYGETARGIGLAANNAVIEIYTSVETGSWTITATLPNGMTCLLATGQSWEVLPDAPVAKGEDV